MTTQHGTFHWNELMTHDIDKARKFYGDTLGWTYDPMAMQDGGTYWIAKAGDAMAGGLFSMHAAEFKNVPDHWLGYVAVDNVDARVDKALKGGANAIRMPFDIPGVGRIAILHAPGGAAIGMITPIAR